MKPHVRHGAYGYNIHLHSTYYIYITIAFLLFSTFTCISSAPL